MVTKEGCLEEGVLGPCATCPNFLCLYSVWGFVSGHWLGGGGRNSTLLPPHLAPAGLLLSILRGGAHVCAHMSCTLTCILCTHTHTHTQLRETRPLQDPPSFLRAQGGPQVLEILISLGPSLSILLPWGPPGSLWCPQLQAGVPGEAGELWGRSFFVTGHLVH